MPTSTDAVDSILRGVPHQVPGPGGAAAVIKDGKVVGAKAWGYADMNRNIPMTTNTIFPICSISKQMVCLVMVSLLKNPTQKMIKAADDSWTQMNSELKKLLPGYDGLTLDHLYNMQSGIRDYWAMSTLWGAKPDDPFSYLRDAPASLQRLAGYHFEPGTEFSYSNVNFHLLGRVSEVVSGLSLAQLLVDRLFIPAKMTTAALCPNTNGLPLPLVGYEGNDYVGWFASTNRMEWYGDAGISASLEDMIAYEKYLDASLQDPESLYMHTMQKQTFKDGSDAAYGYGLFHRELDGKAVIGHGGALRGYRLARDQVPSERLSVVVMLNHEANPGVATEYVLKRLLDISTPVEPVLMPSPEWLGSYLDGQTKLAITVKQGDEPGKLKIHDKNHVPDTVKVTASSKQARSPSMTIRVEGETLHAERPRDGRTIKAKRIAKPDDKTLHHLTCEDYAGAYRCEGADSTFHVVASEGASVLGGSFTGYLGKGPGWLMRYVGEDVWYLGTPRGLDATPPGDWTIIFHRSDAGKVTGCTVGNWLARKLEFSKTA